MGKDVIVACDFSSAEATFAFLDKFAHCERKPFLKIGMELYYAETAKNAGLDGGVCSPLEASKVHDRCGKTFLTITPGVRFADGDIGDQKRVMTPAAAKEIGSDYIVVGRPITAAADPVAAYERCVAEFCD